MVRSTREFRSYYENGDQVQESLVCISSKISQEIYTVLVGICTYHQPDYTTDFDILLGIFLKRIILRFVEVYWLAKTWDLNLSIQRRSRSKVIHTYIIGHYNPSVRIIDLVSHITYVVCVNFIHKWRGTYSLTSTPNDRFF